jgi:hypothetical protein
MPVSHSPLTLSTTLLIRGTGSRWAVTFRAHLGVALGSVFLSGPIGLILLAEACLQLRSGLRCLVGHRTLRSLEQWEPLGFEGRLPVHLPLASSPLHDESPRKGIEGSAAGQPSRHRSPSVPLLSHPFLSRSTASVRPLKRRYREEVFLSGAPLDADELQPRRSKPVGGSFIV